MPRPIEELRRITTELLRRHKITALPVPIERIARALGAELHYLPYDGDLSGMMHRNHNRIVIGVNSLHHPNRQRFTIAHELGHMLLHSTQETFIDRGSIVFNRDVVSAQGIADEEIDANRFASELLMPFHFIKADLVAGAIDIEDETTLSNLAKKYRVSPQALTWRMNNLTERA